jgi:hypothetical protein
MVFHRAAKIGSLVNPQLDDFRRIMFNPAMYTTWERLMVGTGLQNNQLFPGLLGSLVIASLVGLYNAGQSFLSAGGADASGSGGVDFVGSSGKQTSVKTSRNRSSNQQ